MGEFNDTGSSHSDDSEFRFGHWAPYAFLYASLGGSHSWSNLQPQVGWSVWALTNPGSGGGTVTAHYWPNYVYQDSATGTITGYTETNSVMLGQCITNDCGWQDGHPVIKYFSIEEGIKTQAEIETKR